MGAPLGGFSVDPSAAAARFTALARAARSPEARAPLPPRATPPPDDGTDTSVRAGAARSTGRRNRAAETLG